MFVSVSSPMLMCALLCGAASNEDVAKAIEDARTTLQQQADAMEAEAEKSRQLRGAVPLRASEPKAEPSLQLEASVEDASFSFTGSLVPVGAVLAAAGGSLFLADKTRGLRFERATPLGATLLAVGIAAMLFGGATDDDEPESGIAIVPRRGGASAGWATTF